MSGFWKMLTDDNTPRRAIMEFLDKATPKESAVTEELIQTNKVGSFDFDLFLIYISIVMYIFVYLKGS